MNIGIIFSLASLVMVLLHFTVGRATDYFDRRYATSFFFMLRSLANFFMPLSTSALSFSFLRGISSFCSKTYTTLKESLIGDLLKAKERSSLFRLLGQVRVASRATAMLVGFLVAKFVSLEWCFYASSALLVLATFFVFLLPKPKKTKLEKERKLFFKIKLSSSFLKVSIIGVLAGLTFTSSYYPGFFLLADKLGFSKELLFIPFLVAYSVSSLLFFLFKNKLKQVESKKLMLYGFYAFSLSVFFYSLATTKEVFIVILTSSVFSYTIFWVGFKDSLVQATSDRQRGGQLSAFKIFDNIGKFLGPLIGGTLASINLSFSFYPSLVFLLIVLVLQKLLV